MKEDKRKKKIRGRAVYVWKQLLSVSFNTDPIQEPFQGEKKKLLLIVVNVHDYLLRSS